MTTLLPVKAAIRPDGRDITARCLVACPDARPPAYQAAIGLADAGLLDRFVTGVYYRGDEPWAHAIRKIAPRRFERIERSLRRRHHPAIPSDRVVSTLGFDLGLALENRVERLRSPAARWRTRHFDRVVASRLEKDRPDVLFAFSDVGSAVALPRARRLGIPVVLSVVHGEVEEERAILEREQARSPEFVPIYLGDGRLDLEELGWLHDRRRRDAAGADRILVPSEHIAGRYRDLGIPADRLRVIPYAADTDRFRPIAKSGDDGHCTFLFAGGITQRKGIGYLLRAWARVRRPGWRLQLLGGLPANHGPLLPYLDGVALLGKIPHHEVPERMAAADVFVFPSLFEGSAVVTYEAMACGLPSIVTPSAGSVARDGAEAMVVPPADVEALACAMIRLGTDRQLRERLGAAARHRAEEFGWNRYHRAVAAVVREVTSATV